MKKKEKKKKKRKRTKKEQFSIANRLAIIGLFLTIIGIAVTIIIAVVDSAIDDFRAKPYRFRLVSSILKTEDRIIIIADNEKTNINKPLDVKFDGHLFYSKGEKYGKTNNSMRRWVFDLEKYSNKATPKMLKRGQHTICFAFKGEKFSEVQNIYFTANRKIIPTKKTSTDWTPILVILLIAIIVVVIIAAAPSLIKFFNNRRNKENPPGGGGEIFPGDD
jgi:heme/copper-type cytochrome/quinol oxidase subunit 2